ncbi:hypothetical protein [Deferrisoma palaeochoriense]
MSQFDQVWARIRALTGWRYQSDLARFLGISRANVSEAKRLGVFRVGWAEKVAREYGVPAEMLLWGEERRGEETRATAERPPAGAAMVEALVRDLEAALAAVSWNPGPEQKARLAGFLFDWAPRTPEGMVAPEFVRQLVRLLAESVAGAGSSPTGGESPRGGDAPGDRVPAPEEQ